MAYGLALPAWVDRLMNKLCAAVLVLCAIGGQSLAAAPGFVRADCARVLPPYNTLTFDDSTHRAWYRRFWTGNCAGLPMFSCVSGSPNWNAFVDQAASRANIQQRPQIIASACRLGHLIGFEWAKDNAIRRISTADLPGLTDMALNNPDIATGLRQATNRANAMLGQR